MLNNINTVFYTVTFILPGFIISYIKSKFVPIRIIHTSEYIFRYFFYSAINMFISIPGLYYMIDCQYKCNTLYSCCIKYLCRCPISKTLARSIIYYGNNIIKFFLIYRRKIKLFRVKLS